VCVSRPRVYVLIYCMSEAGVVQTSVCLVCGCAGAGGVWWSLLMILLFSLPVYFRCEVGTIYARYGIARHVRPVLLGLPGVIVACHCLFAVGTTNVNALIANEQECADK
jgi:hypothetical protein